MVKVKEGDLDKMSLLYERHHRALYGFIFRMTAQKELSEDLVQNVFLRMLKYRHGFTGKGEFKTWMYHLARNVMNDHFRRNKRIPYHHDAADYEERIAGDEFADLQLEKRQELKTLQMALNNLTEESREVLILCRFQGLKYAEIASVLEISEGAVKVRVHRALNQLKNNFLKIAN